MKSICILLTDHKSINENLIIKSKNKLIKSNLNKIYFVGDKNFFPKIFLFTQKNKKFHFININIINKNFHNHLKKITKISINLIKKKKIKYLINMPLNKKRFLNNKYLGFTEFFSNIIDKKKNENMVLYNDNFSVCPLTTHIELKHVEKNVTKKKLLNCINNIVNFYKKIKKDVSIIVLGLNPHASKDFKNKTIDYKMLSPLVKNFKKKGVKIFGPVSADTAFENTKKKIFIGMYHDQVLIPFKMFNKFNGINITIGKKIIRMSPDHGTAENILDKKKLINNQSFLKCIQFCEKH